MLKIKKLSLFFLSTAFVGSCGMFDTTVTIYGAYEYNCTTNELRVLNSDDPVYPFLKKKSWYTQDEFYQAYVDHALEPYEDVPLSESTLQQITPTLEDSNTMFNEIKNYVDCENPKDVLL